MTALKKEQIIMEPANAAVLISDKELVAADGIMKALAPIVSHDERSRVVRYICQRFSYK